MIIKAVKKLLPLFIVQFFTWFALFALWIYATPVVTRYFFNTTNSESIDFEKGTQWVSVCFALYATLAAFLAFYITRLSKIISKERLHSLGLIIGSIGLLFIFLIRNKWSLMLSFSFIGIAWSSISNISLQDRERTRRRGNKYHDLFCRIQLLRCDPANCCSLYFRGRQ